MESESTVVKHPFVFTADGATYFGIWIVNLLLTIVTVGLYSPWAKVRRLRYFYGNTLVDGSPFEYHGRPLALLRGRLIGVALLVGYTQAAKVSVQLWLAVVALIAAGLPWLLWKSQQFRLANSSYRGIRFGFDGTLGEAYATFAVPLALFLAPYAWMLAQTMGIKPGQAPAFTGFIPALLLLLVFFLLLPWFYLRMKRFQHGKARLGNAPFSFAGTALGAYGLAFATLGLGLLAGIVGAVLGALTGFLVRYLASATDLLTGAARRLGADVSGQADQMVGVFAGAAVGYLAMLCIYPLSAALRQNFVWGRTSLGGAPFESHAQGLILLRITVVNALLLLVTLGFYWPYAVVRTLRYQVGVLSWTGDPGAFQAHATGAAVTAAGEEATELLGFDLAL